MNIEDRVLRVIADQLGLTNVNGQVNINSTRDSLGMDSLDDVECIMVLEEEFDIEIQDIEAERLKSIQDCITCVTSKVNMKGYSFEGARLLAREEATIARKLTTNPENTKGVKLLNKYTIPSSKEEEG